MIAWILALHLNGSDSVVTGRGEALHSYWEASASAQKSARNASGSQGAERYSVQVYAGRRSDANAVFARLTDSVGAQVPVVLHFDEPQFKVFVGIYGSRLEAEYALRKWRARYPTAFAVQ
ncbi:MAG: hypothetical protein RL753_940, partial [Bacteroidota bacterium]